MLMSMLVRMMDHTGIYLSSGCAHSGVVYTFLQFGADPNLKTNDGWTPLMIACHNCQLNVNELVILILIWLHGFQCSIDNMLPFLLQILIQLSVENKVIC